MAGLFVVVGGFAIGACTPVYTAAGETPREVARPRTLETVLASLVWPLAFDGASDVTSGYGIRPHPSNGVSRFHTGLDLRADGGDPVYAVGDGRVVESGVAAAYGNRIVLDHGAEVRSLYGHNRTNLVRVGDLVARGEIIAQVGRTGNATGDHLHFELQWRGGFVDPRPFLPALALNPNHFAERGEREP